MKKLHEFNIQVTDTFGGEANYSWVKEFKISAYNVPHAIRKAKKELGIGHIRHKKTEYSAFEVRLDFAPQLLWCVFID